MSDNAVDSLKNIIATSERIVFFGGAGVSTESGIPDFRSADGIYSLKYKHPPETMVSSEFFHSNTEDFYGFYKDKMLHPHVLPNKAHIKLAELEAEGKLAAVVTQNIDGLHQAAGSKNVLELHGSVHRNYCMACRKYHGLDYILNAEGVPRCSCGGIVKPDVVLFGESLDNGVIDKSIRFISEADTLIVGGTSLGVYPAAGLINYYKGNKLVLINKTETPMDRRANLVMHGSIGEILGVV